MKLNDSQRLVVWASVLHRATVKTSALLFFTEEIKAKAIYHYQYTLQCPVDDDV